MLILIWQKVTRHFHDGEILFTPRKDYNWLQVPDGLRLLSIMSQYPELYLLQVRAQHTSFQECFDNVAAGNDA
jgi:hypothetical protein